MGRLPVIRPVPSQPGSQPGPLPVIPQGPTPSAAVWRFIRRYVINPAALDTSQFGDISLPLQGLHAKIIWRARDTSANTVGSFGGMQVAVQGGAIDTGAHYNWSDDSATSNPVTDGVDGATNAVAMNAIVTQGGADGSSGSGQFATGEITLPFYSLASRATFEWVMAQANPGNQFSRSGSGVYWFAEGPVTKVRFFANPGGGGNFAAFTTFDVMALMPV